MSERSSQAVSNSNIAPALSTLARSNKSTIAAVGYLTATCEGHGIANRKNPHKIECKHCDHFDHLMAICFRAKGNLYVNPSKEDRMSGSGSLTASTRHWIDLWLLAFLAPYTKMTEAEVIAAANRGEFRFIGRKCKLALIDHLRTEGRKPRETVLSLDIPIAVDDDGNELTLQGDVSTATLPGEVYQSKLGRTHLDTDTLASTLQLHGDEFRKLLGDRLFETLRIIVAAYPEDLGKQELTERIMERQAVKEWQARENKRRLVSIMRHARGTSRAAGHLYQLLDEKRRADEREAGRRNRRIRTHKKTDAAPSPRFPWANWADAVKEAEEEADASNPESAA